MNGECVGWTGTGRVDGPEGDDDDADVDGPASGGVREFGGSFIPEL